MCFSLLPYYIIAGKKNFVLNIDGATFCAKINHKSGLFRLQIMYEVGPLCHTQNQEKMVGYTLFIQILKVK